MLTAALVVPSSAVAEPSLSVDGTEFVITSDRAVRRGLDIVGATLTLRFGEKLTKVTIAAAEEDLSAHGGRVFLYRFVTSDGRELCAPDAHGKSYGFPVQDDRHGFVLTCTSGAIGKCVRWGYRPWEQTPDGPPLRALHAACVFMVRADYGGDGTSMTIDGATVYVCDRLGVRNCDENPPLAFEAGWGANGATCVARPRISTKISLEQLRKRYPKLRSHLGERACTAQGALKDPNTLLLNRSAAKKK